MGLAIGFGTKISTMSSNRLRLLGALVLSSFVTAVPTPETSIAVADDNHWVTTWTSMPQEVEQSNLPPSPFVRRVFAHTSKFNYN